jgi:YHS domain-containing protein
MVLESSIFANARKCLKNSENWEIQQTPNTLNNYVKTNQGEMIMKNTTAAKDPVCGMDIETATAAGRTEYKGQTYYFCGSKCKEKFDLNPEQYWGKSAETPKSGHGCCS